jgi:hypothetical protein
MVLGWYKENGDSEESPSRMERETRLELATSSLEGVIFVFVAREIACLSVFPRF